MALSYDKAKRHFMRKILPVCDRRLYFITVQPYPNHKSFKRCQSSCGPVKDFLKKHVHDFFIVKELCKSGLAHFHAIALFKPNKIKDIKKCRFGSVDIRRTKAKLFKPVYPWNGKCSPYSIDIVGFNKFDKLYPLIYSFSLDILNKQYRALVTRNRYLRRTWDSHPYRQELRDMFRYIGKDIPTLRYRDFDYHTTRL